MADNWEVEDTYNTITITQLTNLMGLMRTLILMVSTCLSSPKLTTGLETISWLATEEQNRGKGICTSLPNLTPIPTLSKNPLIQVLP